MATLLAPVAKAPTYVKVANYPGLYRHARSGRYYACKKLGGIRRERSLGTCDRKIAERRMKEWLGSLQRFSKRLSAWQAGDGENVFGGGAWVGGGSSGGARPDVGAGG